MHRLRVVEVETFVGTGIDAVGSGASTSGVYLCRGVARSPTWGISKGVTVVGNLEHLDVFGYAAFADTAISVHVASIPMLEWAFIGVVGRSRIEMWGILCSGT